MTRSIYRTTAGARSGSLDVEPLARQAFVAGFSLLLWVAGLAALLGALVVGTLMRNPIPAPYVSNPVSV